MTTSPKTPDEAKPLAEASAAKKKTRPVNPFHLGIQHPEFRYTQSTNPYWAKLKEFEGRVYSDNDTETHRGHWREFFPDSSGPAGRPTPEKKHPSPSRELHVEIGCNAGHVVVEWARQNPSAAYIGIDWKFKQIFRGAEKAVKKGADNLMFFRAHADRLPFMFGEGEIDRLYLFFPDPWAKKAQLKNRFITADNLRRIATPVKKGGIFHIKTDHFGYFQWMEAAVAETKDLWSVEEHTTDLHGGHPDPTKLQIPDVTLFERLFIKDGIKINSMKLRRL